jgi:hypothetical protein
MNDQSTSAHTNAAIDPNAAFLSFIGFPSAGAPAQQPDVYMPVRLTSVRRAAPPAIRGAERLVSSPARTR